MPLRCLFCGWLGDGEVCDVRLVDFSSSALSLFWLGCFACQFCFSLLQVAEWYYVCFRG